MRTASTSQQAVRGGRPTGIEAARQTADESFGGGAPSQSVLRGLCVNCNHRRYCTYPRPPGGVWSCDEYA